MCDGTFVVGVLCQHFHIVDAVLRVNIVGHRMNVGCDVDVLRSVCYRWVLGHVVYSS